MDGVLPIGLAVATAVLFAASLRLPSLVETLLAAYLGLVAQFALVTEVLSPFRGVTFTGLSVSEAVLFGCGFAAWWLRGRPRLPLAGARPAVREILADPVTLLFLGVTVAALAYGLVLALAPANNWDSLTYHLARVADWKQYGGIHWIQNAPSDRMNEFQPLAEQEILFLFVATGKGILYAMPQYVAELAILVAVYGAARRLGFAVRAAACGAFLLSTFTLVALEATTAQNDLVAASFPVVAACLVLAGGPVQLALAGAAIGFGLGAKLTTAVVWPVLAVLVWTRGRRAFALVGAGALAGFVAVGMSGYLRNLIHTGSPLGHGASLDANSASPSFPGSIQTGVHVLFRMLDLSVLSSALIGLLFIAGLAVGFAFAYRAYERGGSNRDILRASVVGIPFAAPALVAGLALLIGWLARVAHIPVRTSSPGGGINRSAGEDSSAFGPIGAFVLLLVPVLTFVAYRARRADVSQLALACSLPMFILFLALTSVYNPFLNRFLIVPVVLTAPLFGRLFRDRWTTAAIVLASTVTIALTLTHDLVKPLRGSAGRPWQLSEAGAVSQTPEARVRYALVGYSRVSHAFAEYSQRVPAGACVGAILGFDDPGYLLWAPGLNRRISFLTRDATPQEVTGLGISYLVIGQGVAAKRAKFRAAGWKVESLSRYWTLAVAPGASGVGSAAVESAQC